MAVDKTRKGKEVAEKPTIISSLGEKGKEKRVTTFLN
jgi:3-dehydroquinate dehydratase